LVAAAAVSILIRHIGPKWPLFIGTVVATGTFAFLLGRHDAHWHFYLATGLLGLGLGLVFGAIPTLLNSGVSPEQTSSANSVNATLRSIGGSIGTAIATAILAANTLPGVPLPAFGAYSTAFAVCGGICVLAVIAAALLPYRHRTARELSGAIAGGSGTE
jgi:MFS family permease